MAFWRSLSTTTPKGENEDRYGAVSQLLTFDIVNRNHELPFEDPQRLHHSPCVRQGF
jgi:hypothetical protein